MKFTFNNKYVIWELEKISIINTSHKPSPCRNTDCWADAYPPRQIRHQLTYQPMENNKLINVQFS